MTVFVTGGTGVVGRAIVERLVGDGRRVRGLVRSAAAAKALIDAGVEEVVEGDVLDRRALARGMDGAEAVYHVAGRNELCALDPAPMLRVNVEGSRRVAEAAGEAGVRRMVYTSSAAAIGERRGTVGTEDSAHRGWYLSHYEQSKHLAEEAVRAVAERTGLDVVHVLPSSVQGPGRASGTGKLLLDAVNGRLPGVVDTWVSIVDVADCAEGHLLAEERGAAGERYLLNGVSLRIREGLELLEGVTGVELDVRTLPGALASAAAAGVEAAGRLRRRRPPFCREMVATMRHGHVYDGSKATRELGLRYTPIERTLAGTMRWFAAQGLLRRGLPGLVDA